jgi:hypothetical protein
MTATTAPTFRYIGVTDECIECQRCGKTDLKSTVILMILDAEGNDEEVTYYGSTCAARALAAKGMRVKGGGAAILQAAYWRTEKLRQEAQEARQRLAKYGIPEEPVDLTPRQWLPIRMAFVENNTKPWEKEIRYGHPDFKGPEYWQSLLERCIAGWRATLADAKLVGV